MQSPRPWIDRTESRRDARYLLPALDVMIDGGKYRAINWSMGGLLIDGVCHDIGSRVRGAFGLIGSCELMPFVATVVRIDPRDGSCAICFDDPGLDYPEPDENPFGEMLH